MDYEMSIRVGMGVLAVIIIVIATFTFYQEMIIANKKEELVLNEEALTFFEEYIARHPDASDEEIKSMRKKLFGI